MPCKIEYIKKHGEHNKGDRELLSGPEAFRLIRSKVAKRIHRDSQLVTETKEPQSTKPGRPKKSK
jgi:hypothetical protein